MAESRQKIVEERTEIPWKTVEKQRKRRNSPQVALPSRSLLMVRNWSQRITLGVFSPPSGGSTRRWDGMFFDFATFEVSGTVITNPASSVLKASSLITSM